MSDKKTTEEGAKAMSSKSMLEEANAKKRVIRHADRVKLKIVKKTKHYREGQIINPHPLVAEQLIKNKVAEKA